VFVSPGLFGLEPTNVMFSALGYLFDQFQYVFWTTFSIEAGGILKASLLNFFYSGFS
jgi:hypothetical protein